MTRFIVCLVVADLFVGCVQTLPPPAAPEAVLGRMRSDLPSPRSGEGRVAIDVADGPTRVDEITSTSGASVSVTSGWVDALAVAEASTRHHLCVTPCMVNLSYGAHDLLLTSEDQRIDTLSVTAGVRPSAYRRVLARRERPLQSPGAVAGFILAIAGGALGGIGLPLGALFVDDGGLGVGLLVMGAIGALLAALGVPLMVANPAIQQPGATAEWPLPSR
jgi:hypothetical protein